MKAHLPESSSASGVTTRRCSHPRLSVVRVFKCQGAPGEVLSVPIVPGGLTLGLGLVTNGTGIPFRDFRGYTAQA